MKLDKRDMKEKLLSFINSEVTNTFSYTFEPAQYEDIYLIMDYAMKIVKKDKNHDYILVYDDEFKTIKKFQIRKRKIRD